MFKGILKRSDGQCVVHGSYAGRAVFSWEIARIKHLCLLLCCFFLCLPNFLIHLVNLVTVATRPRRSVDKFVIYLGCAPLNRQIYRVYGIITLTLIQLFHFYFYLMFTCSRHTNRIMPVLSYCISIYFVCFCVMFKRRCERNTISVLYCKLVHHK